MTERSKYPDMVFRHRSSDTKFAVECKYRSKWEINGNAPQIEWAEEHNIENYLQFSEERNPFYLEQTHCGKLKKNGHSLEGTVLRYEVKGCSLLDDCRLMIDKNDHKKSC